MAPSTPWWSPQAHRDRRPFLLARNRVQAALRQWFADQGFVEADPVCLQVSPGNETHLHAFATEEVALDGHRRPLYLHTSPEFALKKLLTAGEHRLFAFAHAFRNRERSRLHHPEFVMLEWYRAGEGYERLMQDCDELLRVASRSMPA
jgi:elongation factor P--(R)-beta-lysine ligase